MLTTILDTLGIDRERTVNVVQKSAAWHRRRSGVPRSSDAHSAVRLDRIS